MTNLLTRTSHYVIGLAFLAVISIISALAIGAADIVLAKLCKCFGTAVLIVPAKSKLISVKLFGSLECHVPY